MERKRKSKPKWPPKKFGLPSLRELEKLSRPAERQRSLFEQAEAKVRK